MLILSWAAKCKELRSKMAFMDARNDQTAIFCVHFFETINFVP